MTRTLTACLIVAAGIALAGCGSSSSGLAKSELASNADAICSSYTKSASAIPQPKDFVTNPVSAATYLDQLRPLAAAQKKAMLALKPDSSVKPLWDQFVAGGEHLTALLGDADAEAHAKDRAGLADLEQLAS